MAVATLTSKGQVTIPKSVRDRLRLKAGDRLRFDIDEHGDLHVHAQRNGGLGEFIGILSHLARKRPVSIAEMKLAVRKRAAERERRSRS